MNDKKSKFATGWLIVIACMLIQAIPFGVASNIHPQFLGYIMEQEKFALASISAMFTIGTIISALFSPTIGKLYNKLPAKLIFAVGSVISASGVFMLSIAGNRLGMFYVGYGIAQIGASAISAIGIPILITSWFDDNSRGKALGLAFAGSGLGNIFLQKISASWIAGYGYQVAYQKFALLSAIVGAVVSIVLIRMPKNNSEVVVSKNANTEEKKSEEVSVEGYTFKEASKLKAYWIFAIGFVFIGIYVSALATQYSAYFKASGAFTKEELGNIGALFAACSLIGNLVGGTLYDKLGITKTTIMGFVLATISCVGVMFGPQVKALAYVYAAAKGLSVFAYILAPAMLAGALFGKKDFNAILGITQVFFAFGFAFGSFIFGLIVDKAGYMVAWSFILAAIFACYSMLLIAIASMNKLKKSTKEVEEEVVA